MKPDEAVSRFDLYEWCVQTPIMQARFLDALHGPWQRGPRMLRDDFCGPASIARAWVTLGPSYSAVGVDADDQPLDHARHRARGLARGARARLELVRQSVLRPVPARGAGSKPGVICAFNFALCELHQRRDLLRYLRLARAALAPGGVFAADLYGGSTAFIPGSSTQRVPTPVGAVRYTWEQRDADPFTCRVRNAIHFSLPRQPAMRDAFTYDWRLWGVAELCDAMTQAGFSSTEVHTGYGDAMTSDGKPIPRSIDAWPALDASEHDAWVAYVVGRTIASRA